MRTCGHRHPARPLIVRGERARRRRPCSRSPRESRSDRTTAPTVTDRQQAAAPNRSDEYRPRASERSTQRWADVKREALLRHRWLARPTKRAVRSLELDAPPGYARAMYHLRIVAPPERSEETLDLLKNSPSVCNVIFLEGVAQEPRGDVILADVAREDASVIISDLRELRLHEGGLDRAGVDRDRALQGGGEGREGGQGRAFGCGHLGAGGVPDIRGGQALGFLSHLHPAGDANRRRRALARLADPDRRRDGRRSGVRPDRRLSSRL